MARGIVSSAVFNWFKRVFEIDNGSKQSAKSVVPSILRKERNRSAYKLWCSNLETLCSKT